MTTDTGPGAGKPHPFDPKMFNPNAFNPLAPEPQAPDALNPELLHEANEFAANMAQIVEKSQEIWGRFLQATMAETAKLHPDPLNASPAFTELSTAMFSHPEEVAEATMKFWTQQGELWRRMAMKALGEAADPVVEPAPGDRRFAAKDWSENQVFDYIKQSYLLTSNWVTETFHSIGDIDERDRRKVDFYTRTFLEALSPTNFATTNPDVIRATLEEKGENLVRGLNNMLKDLERGKGKLLIRQTDMEAFKVGENMAVTPGKVVFQNEILQLIQYAPTTEKVYAKPLLIIPPWINKFYILDLNQKKSMIRWLVAEGYTVFVISWVNPDERHRGETWESYIEKGVYAALDKVIEETGVKKVNVASYCIGGTLTTTALALAAKNNDDRVESATFFTALTDFSDAGELQLFTDDETVEILGEEMDEKGYLEAQAMAGAFNSLRSSDLIWGFVIQNYMLGKDPFPFDLLYWNSDSTCMPGGVHRYYLETFYQDNKLAQGELSLAGKTLNLGDIKLPVYHVATKEDHIAPAATVYLGARMFGGDTTFVLAGSGHIAGVVNPPEPVKYQHWTNPSLAAETMAEWMENTEETTGSWWPNWSAWLAKRIGRKVAAREPGAKLSVVEDAPGSYVKICFDER